MNIDILEYISNFIDFKTCLNLCYINSTMLKHANHKSFWINKYTLYHFPFPKINWVKDAHYKYHLYQTSLFLVNKQEPLEMIVTDPLKLKYLLTTIYDKYNKLIKNANIMHCVVKMNIIENNVIYMINYEKKLGKAKAWWIYVNMEEQDMQPFIFKLLLNDIKLCKS